MRAINEANEPEIKAAWDALVLVLSNQFLEEAGIPGVQMWEKELRIIPKNTDTLAIRKARIRAMWERKPPYTVRWLGRWLTGLCGSEGHKETVTDYTLDIWLNAVSLQKAGISMNEVMVLLEELLPANIWRRFTASLEMQSAVCFGGCMSTQIRFTVPEVLRGPQLEGAVRAGGRMAAEVRLPIPEI